MHGYGVTDTDQPSSSHRPASRSKLDQSATAKKPKENEILIDAEGEDDSDVAEEEGMINRVWDNR